MIAPQENPAAVGGAGRSPPLGSRPGFTASLCALDDDRFFTKAGKIIGSQPPEQGKGHDRGSHARAGYGKVLDAPGSFGSLTVP